MIYMHSLPKASLKMGMYVTTANMKHYKAYSLTRKHNLFQDTVWQRTDLKRKSTLKYIQTTMKPLKINYHIY
jgi:hypothetical protein